MLTGKWMSSNNSYLVASTKMSEMPSLVALPHTGAWINSKNSTETKHHLHSTAVLRSTTTDFHCPVRYQGTHQKTTHQSATSLQSTGTNWIQSSQPPNSRQRTNHGYDGTTRFLPSCWNCGKKGHTLYYCDQPRAPQSDIEQRRAEDNRHRAERAKRLATGTADTPGGPPSSTLVTFLPPGSIQGEQFSTLGAQPEGRKEPIRLT